MLERFPKPDKLFQGQPYWRIGDTDYAKKDGSVIALEVWETFCADCGEPFVVTAVPSTIGVNRRCKAHARPGVRVARRRRVPV